MSSEDTAIPQQNKLKVVLFWHMHQPEYRDLRDGHYHQPWTYLHVIKDYVDMAAHLEKNPQARAVINFVPVLLEQIEDYRVQLEQYLFHGGAIHDPLLAALADPVIFQDRENAFKIIKDCLRANQQRMIDRYPVFQQLASMARVILQQPDTVHYYDEQYVIDLLVWYHLAWMGETVQQENTIVQNLIQKARLFTIHDRRLLIEVIHQLIAGVIERYRRLAEEKRIELSLTPYAHPISPLLLDFNSTLQAMPDASLPMARSYPGGEIRNQWQIETGINTFQRFFGMEPQGCWPAEGSVSEAVLAQLDQAGFKWFASGETVLRNSRNVSAIDHDRCLHSSYQLTGQNITGFFRDDGLSDQIGFKFSEWHAEDAVANLIESLGHIQTASSDHPSPIVSIIMDGENAWEYYPNNGYHFLDALYKQLGSHENIELTTYSEYLQQQVQPQQLQQLVAGSWVYGTFSTWIGMQDKNHAWDMLVDAKQVYDEVISEQNLTEEEIELANFQLATCESSDWFWWFGDYNPADSVRAFDEQFRLHLCNLYHLLHREPPDYLSHSFSAGSHESTASGVMLPGQQA